MSCTNNNCKCQNQPCGCADTPLVTLPSCDPVGCPEPYPCTEITDAECVIYTGNDILCNNNTVVEQNTSVADALLNVVNYVCENTGTTVIQAGAGIDVTSVTVGDTTTYTIIAEPVCPMTVRIEGTNLVPRSIQATVTGGTAPYTYAWSMSDFSGFNTSVLSMLQLDATAYPYVVQPALNLTYPNPVFFDMSGDVNAGRIGLAKVTVTDANGCKASDNFLIIFSPTI